MFRIGILFICIPFTFFAKDPSFEKFLTTHCVSCHGPKKEKGDLRIDTLSRDFKAGMDSHLWAEVNERINAGEMPPEEQPRPNEKEISEFIAQLDQKLSEGKAARMAARPPVAHYRLSRKEYQNTVYDLLGVRYDPTKPGELNEDTLWHGYERIGSELSLSPSHMDRYYRAAKVVLDRTFPATTSETRKIRKTAAELRYGGGEMQQELLEKFGIKRPLRYLHFPGRVQPALQPHWFSNDERVRRVRHNVDGRARPAGEIGKNGVLGPQDSGLYRLRLQASGIRPKGGQAAHLSIGKRTGSANVEGIVEFDITAPEDSPEIYEFEVFLEMPVDLHFCVVASDVVTAYGGQAFRHVMGGPAYVFTHSSETLLLNPNAPQMFDGEGNGIFSTVLLDWIEWEGPLLTEEEKSRRSGVLPPDDATAEVVAEHLQHFSERAWRRSVKKGELDDYLESYRADREAGETTADAYRHALLRVLTSRNFIYLVEGEPKPREMLNEHELASRLSYFLWSSMPDNTLLSKANEGKLNDPELKKQVDRMLSDARIERFVDDFSRQWLQLHRVGMFPPDKKLYPTYDDWLETSMAHEPVEFFRELLSNNLPIESLLDSDWTMANARLCDFYGLPEPAKPGFQRVSLKPEHNRGGLLTMGGVLGLTSDGTRHRPVHRGVWLSETIFNKTPPPPPANVDPIEPVPPEGEKITIRQRMEAHTKDPNCAACHKSIDPLGLAFDQYDAIGQWRTHEHIPTGVGKNPPVDASGTLTDGRTFNGSVEFKDLLLDDRDRFARAFIEHLCTYALRRVLTVDDKEDVSNILSEAKKKNYQIKDIVRAVAISDLLRKR